MGSDMYGGRVFGSHTRSTGGSGSRGGSSFDDFFGGSSYGTERHRGVSPDAGRVASTFGSGAPRAKKPSSKVSPTVERKVDRASASQDFAVGDTVSHKTFGTGTVISVAGDMIEVQFEKTGQTKKLMKDSLRSSSCHNRRTWAGVWGNIACSGSPARTESTLSALRLVRNSRSMLPHTPAQVLR